MTTSEIENDQNDLDQNDHVGTTPLTLFQHKTICVCFCLYSRRSRLCVLTQGCYRIAGSE